MTTMDMYMPTTVFYMSSQPIAPATTAAGTTSATGGCGGLRAATSAATLMSVGGAAKPVAATTTRRLERPRPLRMTADDEHVVAPVSLDTVVALMHAVNDAVKGGQLTSTVSSQMFRLCNYLKQYGETLEQNYKDELNRCFVSLRQACCRDSGQLGTPCRLKIMELVELRAMGWRPNLSHSQYYVNRGGGQAAPTVTTAEYPELGPVPISAPPFGSMTLNPFGFVPLGPTPAQDFVSSSVSNSGSGGGSGATTGPPAQYFLIPATGGASGGFAFVTPTPATMMTATGAATAQVVPLPPPPPLPIPPPPPPVQLGSSPGPGGGAGWPRGVVLRPAVPTRPVKVAGKNQFKDEIVIRNADSGKIMGIKGRRVAIIEELSRTIVSFQKVAPGAKERGLTITGNSEEDIETAKALIESTIRRNCSPDRVVAGANSDGDDEIHLAVGDAGNLIVECADASLLQQAQAILQTHFGRNVQLRRSFTADANLAERKERRKSMPPVIANELIVPVDSSESGGDTGELINGTDEPTQQQQQRAKALSTPNLVDAGRDLPLVGGGDSSVEIAVHTAAVHRDTFADATGGGSVVIETSKARMVMRVVYTREFMLQCALSPYCHISPSVLPVLSEHMPDILRKIPGKFEPAEYKAFCQKLKQRL